MRWFAADKRYIRYIRNELVLICATLGVGVDYLLPDSDEWIELGDGAKMSAEAVRRVLDGTVDAAPDDSATMDMIFPGERKVIDAIVRALPKYEETQEMLAPIRWYSRGHLMRGDMRSALYPPSDAVRHAARRLGLHPAEVKLAARALWDHRDFDEERDRRIGDVTALEARSLQARRGLVARAILAEVREYVAAARAAYDDAGAQADG